jgi:hypothetical protein
VLFLLKCHKNCKLNWQQLVLDRYKKTYPNRIFSLTDTIQDIFLFFNIAVLLRLGVWSYENSGTAHILLTNERYKFNMKLYLYCRYITNKVKKARIVLWKKKIAVDKLVTRSPIYRFFILLGFAKRNIKMRHVPIKENDTNVKIVLLLISEYFLNDDVGCFA